MTEPFGFEPSASKRRRTAGRRLVGDRRMVSDRRLTERRLEIVPITVDRRAWERRSGWERRRSMDRRLVDDRRFSAWRGLEGN